MINQVIPYNYPVLVGDDGNMPDIPRTPRVQVGVTVSTSTDRPSPLWSPIKM